jgi:hypothetical protein
METTPKASTADIYLHSETLMYIPNLVTTRIITHSYLWTRHQTNLVRDILRWPGGICLAVYTHIVYSYGYFEEEGVIWNTMEIC